MELKENNKIEFDMSELLPLFLNGDKQEGFRVIGEKILNSILEKEFEEYIGATKHERNNQRKDYRNGYKTRVLKTTLGELNLLRPYARYSKFETKLFDNYSRIDKALVSIIIESYLKGVSTRKVDAVISALGVDISHTTVSNLSHEIDELITEFKTSPLESYYPYLYVDATYLKVFNGSRFVSLPVIIAIGVNKKGYRQILDITLDNSESEISYKDFFNTLKSRGIKKVDLVTSDGLKGIKKAASRCFRSSSWQLCTIHVKRNVKNIIPKKDINVVLEYIDDILNAKTIQDAHSIGYAMCAEYELKYPKLIKYLEANLDDMVTYLSFPKSHHRRIRTTNMVERFNKEIKRRTKVIGAFPNENSILRLLIPLALDTNAKWNDRKYLSWENLTHNENADEEFTENF